MSLVTLRAHRDPVEAELDRAHLELAGIPALIVDEDLVAVQWDLSAAVGGVKLKVASEDFARADAFLREDRSALLGDLSGGDATPEDDDRCPACGGGELVRSSTRRRWAALALLSGLPLVFGRARSVCTGCGRVWPRRSARAVALAPETLAAERAVQRRGGAPTLLLVAVAGIVLLWSSRHVMS